MTQPPAIISGLHEIADDYDALICDVWGVVHDGVRPYWPAVDALRKFRNAHGPVVLLTNAPRPPREIVAQLSVIGVPTDCYSAVVTSGGAARDDIAHLAAGGTLALMHLGPDRDRSLYEGLDVRLTDAAEASVVLCSGLYDDEKETPEHYREILVNLKNRDLPMICANPDKLVQRGGKLVHCAGGLARFFESLGGKVAYYGKPYAPIYKATMEAAGHPSRPLVVGDGLETDIRGANELGMDALFVVHGVHAGELDAMSAEGLAALFDSKGVKARAAMDALAW
jgi:HAD superfamily hydrolase (TIGR01459 family)